MSTEGLHRDIQRHLSHRHSVAGAADRRQSHLSRSGRQVEGHVAREHRGQAHAIRRHTARGQIDSDARAPIPRATEASGQASGDQETRCAVRCGDARGGLLSDERLLRWGNGRGIGGARGRYGAGRLAYRLACQRLARLVRCHRGDESELARSFGAGIGRVSDCWEFGCGQRS